MGMVCSDTTPQVASLDAGGLDVSAQNDVLLQSVFGEMSTFNKFYDYSRCYRGVGVALTPDQVLRLTQACFNYVMCWQEFW